MTSLETDPQPGAARGARELAMKVLLIEEAATTSALRGGLEAEGHAVDVGRAAEEALRALAGYDLVVLALVPPGDPAGLGALRRLRADGDATPVIAVAEAPAVEDRVRALDAGADDVLARPASVAELLARVRAMRRRSVHQQGGLRCGDLALDGVRFTVTRAGRRITLTPREYQLLHCFMLHPGEPLTRAALAAQAWGVGEDPPSNVVDVYVNYLRKKLGPGPIRTVRGVGYLLVLA